MSKPTGTRENLAGLALPPGTTDARAIPSAFALSRAFYTVLPVICISKRTNCFGAIHSRAVITLEASVTHAKPPLAYAMTTTILRTGVRARNIVNPEVAANVFFAFAAGSAKKE